MAESVKNRIVTVHVPTESLPTNPTSETTDSASGKRLQKRFPISTETSDGPEGSPSFLEVDNAGLDEPARDLEQGNCRTATKPKWGMTPQELKKHYDLKIKYSITDQGKYLYSIHTWNTYSSREIFV